MNKNLFRICVLVLLTVIALTVVSAQRGPIDPNNPRAGIEDTVWLLGGDRNFVLDEEFITQRENPERGVVAVVIIPETTHVDIVQAAWSYAVRYSADGIDLPNYYAAVELLMERHPTWIAAVTKGWTVSYDADSVIDDVPDPEVTPEVSD